MQPGAAHDHTFIGNRFVDANTTTKSLLAGETSCAGGIRNLSSYWFPTLLDSAGRRQEPTQLKIYYKSGYIEPRQKIVSAPKGLRLIGGFDSKSGSMNGAFWGDCARGKDNIRGCRQGDTLSAWIHFPQCWDGKRLDSKDHRSHVVYGSGISGCPSSHPAVIPAITVVAEWTIKDDNGTQGWRLSSDAGDGAPGASLHADWWNGWKQEVMDEFVEHCIRRGRTCNNGDLGNGWRLTIPEADAPIVVDNDDPGYAGNFWNGQSWGFGFIGSSWSYREAQEGGKARARFTPALSSRAQQYDVFVRAGGGGMTSNQPFAVRHRGGTEYKKVDMSKLGNQGTWVRLGRYRMAKGDWVETHNNFQPSGGTRAVADAVKLWPVTR